MKQNFSYLSLRIILCFRSAPGLCLELLSLDPCKSHEVQGQEQVPAPRSELSLVSAQTEGFGVLMHKNLIMTWQSVLAAQKDSCSWGYIKSSVAVRSEEVILRPLFYSYTTPPGVQHPVLKSPVKSSNILKQVMRRVRKIIRAVEHLSYEERLEGDGVV